MQTFTAELRRWCCRAVVWNASLAFAAQAQAAGTTIDYGNPASVQRVLPAALRLTLGASDGHEFHRIAAILPLRDGRLLVVNGGTNELRFFDQSGRRLSVVGRSGRGPGEYSSIRDIARLPGDSLAVFDPGARRVSLLAPDGVFVRSFALQPPFEGGGSPTRMVALSDGTMLIGYSEIQQMAPQDTAVYFTQRLFPYSTSGVLRSTRGMSLPNREHFVQVTPANRGGVSYWDRAFGRLMTIRAESTSLLVGDGTEWTIELRRPDGTVVRTHRLRRPIMPVTAQDREAYGKAVMEGAQGEMRVMAERMIAGMPYPGTKPAFRRFETDGTGRLWIETYPSASQTEGIWIRLDPQRRVATAVEMPPRFRALAFTEQMLYGVWRDEDDVEHVRVYSLDGI